MRTILGVRKQTHKVEKRKKKKKMSDPLKTGMVTCCLSLLRFVKKLGGPHVRRPALKYIKNIFGGHCPPYVILTDHLSGQTSKLDASVFSRAWR